MGENPPFAVESMAGGRDRFFVHTIPPTVVTFMPEIPEGSGLNNVKVEILSPTTDITPATEDVLLPRGEVLDQEVMFRRHEDRDKQPEPGMAAHYAERAVRINIASYAQKGWR